MPARDGQRAADLELHWRPRRIVPALGARWRFHGHPPSDLETLVSSRAGRLLAELHSGNRVALGIAVERGDGMSGSAAAAFRVAEATVAADWQVIALGGGQRSPFDELVDLVGAKAVLRATRDSGLEPELRRHWWWWISVVVVISAISVGAALADKFGQQPRTALVATAAVAALAVVSLLAQRILGTQIAPLLGPSARRKASDALRRDPVDAQTEHAFRGLLHEQLRTDKPRVVVIDDLGECDARVRELVLGYLRRPGRRTAEELWIVFERGSRPGRVGRKAPGEPLIAPYLTALSTDSRFTLWNARQQPLSLEEKDALIRSLTRRPVSREDPRRRLRVVRDLVNPLLADNRVPATELREQLGHRDLATRRAFGLLALAATVPVPAAVSASELQAMAREARGRVPNPIPKLLRSWFPADSRSPAAIGEAVGNVARVLGALLEDRASDLGGPGVVVASVYADTLTSDEYWTDDAYGLPQRDHGHALWALYWHRRLQHQWTASSAERLSHHLRGLGMPLQVRARHGAATAGALCDACIDAVYACLALCVGGLVASADRPEDRGLLEQARLLMVTSHQTVDRPRCDALLSAAWHAYALTGQRQILTTIRLLTADGRSVSKQAKVDLVVGLYLDSLPRDTGEELSFPGGDDASVAVVMDHARIRGVLLAELLQPLNGLYGSARFVAAADAARRDLDAVAERTLARVQTAGKPIASLDILTLTLTALCQVLQKHHARREGADLATWMDRLESTAARGREAQANAATRQDFLLAGLLEQLRTFADAAGLYANADLVSIDVPMAQLEAVHILWHNLEAYELADLAALSRNTLEALLGPRAAHATTANKRVAEYLLGIGGSEADAIHQIHANLLMAGVRLAKSSAKAGVPLIQAARRAIVAQLGHALTFELSQLVLAETAHYYFPELDELLEYVSDPGHEANGLMLIPDEDAPARARALLHAIQDPGSAVTLRIYEALEATRRRLLDPRVLDMLHQELELDRVKRHRPDTDSEPIVAVLTTWRARVWGGGVPGAVIDRRARSTYGYVLTLALRNAEDLTAIILPDALRLLAECRDRIPDLAHVQLAQRVVETLAYAPSPNIDKAAMALGIVRRGAEASARLSGFANNVARYEFLARYDPAHASEHRKAATYWSSLGPELEDERFEHYLNAGELFEVYSHYALRYPALRGPEPSRSRAGASEVPEPLLYNDDGDPVAVAAEFLNLVHTMRHGGPRLASGVGDMHAAIEDAAREHLSGLFWLLLERTELPDDVRELVRRHKRRFDAGSS